VNGGLGDDPKAAKPPKSRALARAADYLCHVNDVLSEEKKQQVNLQAVISSGRLRRRNRKPEPRIFGINSWLLPGPNFFKNYVHRDRKFISFGTESAGVQLVP
jgi:hypothetical protein